MSHDTIIAALLSLAAFATATKKPQVKADEVKSSAQKG